MGDENDQACGLRGCENKPIIARCEECDLHLCKSHAARFCGHVVCPMHQNVLFSGRFDSLKSNSVIASGRLFRTQVLRRAWSAKNCPEQKRHHALLALLKKITMLSEAGAKSNDRQKVTDLACSALIDAAEYCDHMLLEIAELWSDRPVMEDGKGILHSIHELCDSELSQIYGIDQKSARDCTQLAIKRLLSVLEWYGHISGCDDLPRAALTLLIWGDTPIPPGEK